MTDYLADLKAANAARTPGEWSSRPGRPVMAGDLLVVSGIAPIDGVFVAACSRDVGPLIEEVERLRHANQTLAAAQANTVHNGNELVTEISRRVSALLSALRDLADGFEMGGSTGEASGLRLLLDKHDPKAGE